MPSELKPITRKLFSPRDPAEAGHKNRSLQYDLCSRCMDLRLDEVLHDFNPPLDTSRSFDIKIAEVGRFYRHHQDRDCDLCHLLSASRVTNDQLGGDPGEHEDVDELHVFELWQDLSWVRPSSRLHDLLRGQGSHYLVLVPSGFNRDRYSKALELHGERKGFNIIRRRGSSQPQMYAPQIIEPLFDLSRAGYWIHYCKTHHQRLCSKTSKRTIDLHLIDCHSLQVVPSRYHVDYVALSYVWGLPATEESPSGSPSRCGYNGNSSVLPLTPLIADAISVTTSLGFHYLWVDRYCINQDSHSKHQQINQMDSIYQNAELTIVAAAGDGTEYGLPGVFSRRRRQQRKCRIGSLEIIQTMQHPHIAIQSSKWASRGWTFQEAALSRRRLVFTDDQVYFECNAMNCHESLASDLDTLHVINKSEFRDVLQAGLFGHTEKQKYGHFNESTLSSNQQLVRFMGMVEQYTARALTYDSDSLNAFTGIMRKFEASQAAVYQICAVPFTRHENERSTELSFLDGLAWNHKPLACDDDHLVRPRRRLGLPSWTWAGWAGQVQYQGRAFDGMPRSLASSAGMGVHIYVKRRFGKQVNIAAYIDKHRRQNSKNPPIIHIKAPILPPSAFSYDTLANPPKLKVFQHPATLALSVGPWDLKDFCESLMNTDRRQCIYLGHFEFGLNFVMIMVLEAQHGSWSRVGMILVDNVWYSNFRSSWKAFNLKSSGGVQKPFEQGIGEKVKSFRLI